MTKAGNSLQALRAELAVEDERAQERTHNLRRLRREAEAERLSRTVHARLAIARNATQTDAEEITLIASLPESEVAEFNYSTDAASLWLSFYRMPPRLRAFVDALCGLCGGSEGWFEAPDVKIGKRMGRSTKTIQRDRDDLDAWQKSENVTFIEIEDHYTDRKGVRHPHKYRVHLPQFAVEARRRAQASSRWAADPAKAMEQAVKELLAKAPEMPSRKSHRRRELSLEKAIESDLRRAGNLIRKSARKLESVEQVGHTHGYMLPVMVKPEIIAALEHCVAVLKRETAPDPAILAPLDAGKDHQPSGQNVRKETIHSDEVVVGKDVPNDEETLRRVPSIARVMREAARQKAQEVERED